MPENEVYPEILTIRVYMFLKHSVLLSSVLVVDQA